MLTLGSLSSCHFLIDKYNDLTMVFSPLKQYRVKINELVYHYFVRLINRGVNIRRKTFPAEMFNEFNNCCFSVNQFP